MDFMEVAAVSDAAGATGAPRRALWAWAEAEERARQGEWCKERGVNLDQVVDAMCGIIFHTTTFICTSGIAIYR
ncbi:hypothetical protein NL676_018178 [Syzygium grande]|nr:hypothetical protein NL676_018178 [Syzygium grande]